MMRIDTEEIQNWEKEYSTMEGVTLNKREKELLEGSEIKSHEGMVYGRMYADWKTRKQSASLRNSRKIGSPRSTPILSATAPSSTS